MICDTGNVIGGLLKKKERESEKEKQKEKEFTISPMPSHISQTTSHKSHLTYHISHITSHKHTHSFKSRITFAFFCFVDEINTSWRLSPAVTIMSEVFGGMEPRLSATITNS